MERERKQNRCALRTCRSGRKERGKKKGGNNSNAKALPLTITVKKHFMLSFNVCFYYKITTRPSLLSHLLLLFNSLKEGNTRI